MTLGMVLWLWGIFGTIAYVFYIGWTNLDNSRRENALVMIACGPVTQFVFVAIVVTYALELAGRGFYSIRCAYEDWKRVGAGGDR